MIAFNIYLLELFGVVYVVILSLKLILNKKLNKFHNKICLNVFFSFLLYFILNTIWQMSGMDSTESYNILTLDYWLWTIYEFHLIIFVGYALTKINTIYYKN